MENMAPFWLVNLCPSFSSDVNPLDFAVWCVLERKTNKISHSNVDALKAVITEEWKYLSLEVIKASCASFRLCIEAIIQNGGGHIE
uniref:Uncharacterized protein n=1 Tax=Lepeophtheirus salmonis TaxID=72036 RepID=A0A0K2SZ82_LEPSM